MDGTSAQSSSSMTKSATVKKTDLKGKKRLRQGSSEEEEEAPDTVSSLAYQLGLILISLKQHLGPGLNKYIATHEQDLRRVYEGLNALSELSSPDTKTSQATQTDPIAGDDYMEYILTSDLSDEELIELLPKRWPNSLRGKLKLVTDLPPEVKDTCTLRDLRRVGEQDMGNKLAAGDIIKDEITLIGDQTVEEKKKKFKIHYDSGAPEKETLSCLLKAFKKIAIQSPNSAYILPSGSMGNFAKKIISYIFRARETPVYVLTLQGDGGTRHIGNNQIPIKKATPPAEQSRTVIVKAEGKTYAELLRSMKDAVTSEEANNVISLRKGRNEELHVRIQGAEKAEQFTSILRDKAADLHVDIKSRAGRRTVVHIRDVEHDTTEQEVMAAIIKRVGSSEEVKITSMRKGFGETQNITVMTSYRAACKLVEERIRIGWISCRAYIREDEDRCYRCWGTGHRRHECKGPDRLDLCFNCGSRGHKIADCLEPKQCLDCKSGEHRTGAWQCKKKLHD